ncbi:MAG: hypothetical protein ACOY5F_22490 [Pseudomonadota bacterium]
MQRTLPTKCDYNDPHRITARSIADLYCLWRMCPHAGCRRAKACRNDPRDCEPAMALVPPDAADLLEALMDARDRTLGYRAMLDACETERIALDAWRSQVARSIA